MKTTRNKYHTLFLNNYIINLLTISIAETQLSRKLPTVFKMISDCKNH